jgi:hypothetical protein
MAAQQNTFAPPTFSQVVYEAPNGSSKIFLQVNNFNGYVRVGVTKQIFCEAVNDFVYAKSGHCYFPKEVCDNLVKYLPIAKSEAERLDQQVNGYAKPTSVAGVARRGYGHAGFVPAKPAYRRDYGSVAPFAGASCASGTDSDACSTSNGHPKGGKHRATDGYKTDGQEEEANGVEQGSPKKQRIEDEASASEETVVPQKSHTVQRGNVFRRG